MLGLLEPLHKAVSKKFQTAFSNKDLVFSDTKLALLKTRAGPTFQLRYCPALAHKPKGNEKDAKDPKRPRFDPFADPPSELLVAQIPCGHASHFLVLNKYPVIHNHFIIATTANKPQTDLLELEDLEMTHACLRAWQTHEHDGSSRRLYAFFNSGEHSGASQVHRHLQFLPVEDMSGSEPGPWGLLLDGMTTRAHPELPLFHDPCLPFLHFSTPLEDEPSSTDLLSKYLLLLRAALSATEHPSQPLDQEIAIEKNGQTTFSYNLGMTRDKMAICPRKSEAVAVPGAGPESSVALNGTILAGTLMVKHEAEWNLLRETPSLLNDMLASIGYSPTTWVR
ncbi:bifunctional AP-4-A phosphorylase/ADP sulfurylase [Exophiala sideris]|uniref:Bifunctional AP-4-A phosphorylase/ADP sulfurylase n=1 Tax=Exophiala sideris TaxID=1016849 RepID=A0ABR0IYY6_9EURO|nr:bifunctional AP-4-A phosphorylase/ADP sulfurylase [Exophiala sideris]KAK5051208.1 bifunctional AP-4-A phosphorylase/ADP sulfurylase [Exophiala sideris]